MEKERQRERLRQGDVDGNVWVRPRRIIVNDEFGKAMENWGHLRLSKFKIQCITKAINNVYLLNLNDYEYSFPIKLFRKICIKIQKKSF